MVDDDIHQDSKNIISLEHDEWLNRRELGNLLGLEGRQLETVINSDRVVAKTTGDGVRYRHLGPIPSTGESTDKTEDSSGDDRSSKRTDVVTVELDEWTDARASLERIESKLESSREDVRRAVEYARELERECDRLADAHEASRNRRDELRTELDEERGRRMELQQQFEEVVETLEKMSGIRGRYHLERARRQEAEEKNELQTEEIRRLEKRIRQLDKALDDAREAGFSAEIGGLTVEWRKGEN